MISANIGDWALGFACPSSQDQFICGVANDNGAPVGCAQSSQVSLPTGPGNEHAILITGNNGRSGTFNLTWSYRVPATPSATATFRPPSATRTPGLEPACGEILTGSVSFPSGTLTGVYRSNTEGQTDGLDGVSVVHPRMHPLAAAGSPSTCLRISPPVSPLARSRLFCPPSLPHHHPFSPCRCAAP